MTQATTQNGWTEKSLKELVDIFDSKRIPLSTGERTKRKGQFPYYGASNIVDYIDDFIFDGDYLLISEDGENLNTRNTPIAFLASGKFWVNNHAHIVKGKEKHMTKYLYWYFSQLDISPYITGAVQPKLSKSNLESIQIKIPENPDEQRAIAAVLSSLDDKIELLREQNKTLEAMAQELFREWFTEFNFPDADGKPYKKSGGKMIDSELGEIPDGWRVGRLEGVLNLQGGFVHNTKAYGVAISKIAKMGVVDGKSWFNRNSVIKYSERIQDKHRLNEDDLIICTRDVTQDRVIIGNVAITPPDLAEEGLFAGSNTWIVRSDFNKYFLFLLFRDRSFREHIIQSAKGSTIVMITKDAFLRCEVILPEGKLLNSFVEIITPIFERVKNNSQQEKTQSTLRDSLLPRLMSGETFIN